MSLLKMLMLLVVAAMLVAGLSMAGGDGRGVVAQDAPKDTPEAPKPDAENAKPMPVVVRRELSARPKSLDPHLSTDVVSSAQVGMAYEQLFEYDYFARPIRVVPCLAASMPTVSEDGLTWTIKIREGVKFQDDACFPGGKGRDMTASDVVWSFKRLAAHPRTTGYWVFEGKLAGLDEFRETAQTLVEKSGELRPSEVERVIAKAADLPVEGLKAVNDTTLSFTLTAPYPQLIYILCMHYAAVVPHEAVRHYTDTFASHPVGTGPFVLAGGTIPAEPTIITWERSPSYRDVRYPAPRGPVKIGDTLVPESVFAPHVGKRLPLADRVVTAVLPDGSWVPFVHGQFDVFAPTTPELQIAIGVDGKPTDFMTDRGMSFDLYERPSIEYISFNMSDPVLGTAGGDKAKAIRKALSLSIDRAEYVKTHLGGRGTPAVSWVPLSFADHDPQYASPWTSFDPAKGREILKAAGYSVETFDGGKTWTAKDANGEQASVTILVRGMTLTSKDVSRFLEVAGRRVGVLVSPLRLEFREFLKRKYSGRGQSYNAGWVLDYPDSQNIFQLFIESEAKENGLNSSRWRSTAATKVYEELALLDSTNPQVRSDKRALATKFMKLMDEDCPATPMYFQRTAVLRHSWVLPIVPNDFNYSLQKYAYSDPAIRTAWLANMEARKTKKPADPDGK